jgi:hypothetical protein
MSKETPLLLKPYLVAKTIAGLKTETRRVIRPDWSRCLDLDDPDDAAQAVKGNPYGQPGDVLWVRETWKHEFIRPHVDYHAAGVVYQADGAGINFDTKDRAERDWLNKAMRHGDAWRPNIFMPRRYCRLTLTIKSVAVERLHEITTAAIVAEGFDVPAVDYTVPDDPRALEYERDGFARQTFQESWDKINGGRGFPWKENPHVFVVKFEVRECLVHT